MSQVKSIDGLPVVDAKRPLVLHVTAADIAKAAASTQEPERCAVARACQRELHVIEARVHLSRTYLRTNKSNWVRYATPQAMREEIIAFDRGGAFQPQEFTLKPLQPAKQLGADKRKRPTVTKKKRRGKPRAYHRIENVRSGPAVQS